MSGYYATTPFSAADAYASPGPGSGSSSNPFGQTPASRSQSRLSGHTQEGNRAVTPQVRAGRAQSLRGQDEDDEDDDSDEDADWNVYDDFNNARQPPASDRLEQETDRRQTRPISTAYAGSDAGYFRHSLDPSSSTPGFTPYSDYGGAKPQLAPGTQRQSTLLNADSFGFDVRNADPRNPNVLAYQAQQDGGLYAAESHALAGHDPDNKNASGIELVTVPALGTEYSQDEMKGMSRHYKRKTKATRRKDAVSRWGKGEYKICGWLSPRWAVLMAFIGCVILGVLLFFVVPRVPTIAYQSSNALEAVPNSASMVTHQSPTNFSMTMNLNLRADNTAGWIPTHAKSIKVEVKELTTSKKIGEGSLDGISFPGRSKKLFQLPVNFSYRSLNLTGDPTYEAVHSACAHKYTNVNRPNLLLNIKLSMDIVGLVGTKTTGTNLNAPCPFELQNDQ